MSLEIALQENTAAVLKLAAAITGQNSGAQAKPSRPAKAAKVEVPKVENGPTKGDVFEALSNLREAHGQSAYAKAAEAIGDVDTLTWDKIASALDLIHSYKPEAAPVKKEVKKVAKPAETETTFEQVRASLTAVANHPSLSRAQAKQLLLNAGVERLAELPPASFTDVFKAATVLVEGVS